jgi:hypothetical protein
VQDSHSSNEVRVRAKNVFSKKVPDQRDFEIIGEESVEHFGNRPRKPGGWKEDQFPKGED